MTVAGILLGHSQAPYCGLLPACCQNKWYLSLIMMVHHSTCQSTVQNPNAKLSSSVLVVVLTSMYSAAAATDTLNSNRYECWARSQMKYVLGSDGVGHSFVVGFGVTPPVQCHHRAASCPDEPATCTFDNFNADTPNPQVLYGAMVGGDALGSAAS